MLFDILMIKARKDGDTTFESISDFFMHKVLCAKSPNGYHFWNCVRNKCKIRIIKELPILKFSTSDQTATVCQFELTKTPYTTIEKDGVTNYIFARCINPLFLRY